MQIDSELLAKALDDLVSYADGLSKAVQSTGLNEAEIREAALDFNIEQCPNCAWFCESTFLVDTDDESQEPDGFCDNCRKYDKSSLSLHAEPKS